MAEIQRGVIPVAIAARVLKMDCQTLRLLLQNKMVDFGIAYKGRNNIAILYLQNLFVS